MAETKEETKEKLPPPVEPPEYYTGFGAEFEQIGVELQQLYGKLQQAEVKLPVSTPEVTSWFGKLLELFHWPDLLSKAGEYAPLEKLKEQAIAEFDAAAVLFQTAEWKLEVMQVLPVYLSDPNYIIEKPEDILQYVAPGVELSAADTAWLNETYGKLEHLSNVLPVDYRGDVLDAQANILNEILTEPEVEMKGVHRLTVDEIAKAFVFGVAELPAGMTAEDVRGILSEMEIEDEELLSQQEWLAERAREWEIEAARMSLIRAGEILAEAPELAPLDYLKLVVTQPMMATVEVMQKWWDKISRPISAAIMMNMPAPAAGAVHGVALGAAAGGAVGAMLAPFSFGASIPVGAAIGAIVGAIGGAGIFAAFESDADKELTVHYEFYRELGESAWSSYAKAFNEWEAPWWKKMILDSAYDPLMWLGWGGVAAVGSKLTKMVLPRGLKWAGSRIGSLMVAFENGYVAGMDAVFKAGLKVIAAPIKSAFWLTGAGYTIPATFTQMSRRFGHQGIKDFFAVAGRTYKDIRGKFGVGMTGKDANELVEAAIGAALKSPQHGTSPLVRLGTSAMEFNYLDDVAAAKFVAEAVEGAAPHTIAISAKEVVEEASVEVAESLVSSLPSRLQNVLTRLRATVGVMKKKSWEVWKAQVRGRAAKGHVTPGTRHIAVLEGMEDIQGAIAHEAGHLIARQYGLAKKVAALSDDLFDEVMSWGAGRPGTLAARARMRGLLIDGDYNTVEGLANALKLWIQEPKLVSPSLGKFFDDVLGDITGAAPRVLPGLVWDTSRLARLNAQLCDAFSGQGAKVTAGNILNIMGMSDIPDAVVRKLAYEITKFKKGVARTAIEALKGDTADQVIKKIGSYLELSRYNNLHSPLTKWMQQAGRSSSWHSRVADKILYSARMVAMERRVVMPVARWQLLFTNFGPYNYLENSGRSFLGGAELMHPKAFGGVDEALRVFRGISSTDFDLIMAQRGVRRLTQAVVDPKTGTTAVFKGGKIPLVTTRLRIPEKIPRWGGKYIGKTLTIGDKRYFLGSAQDWYDMWADLTMKQNAYDLQVHFLHALDDIAPNDMAGIYKVVSNNKHLLDDVRSITKREAFDIDREMGLEIIGGGPDSVRAFADIDVITMQRRQLSMRFKRDTMDKMEDVRSVIKRGVDDEILDGTMFTKGHISIDDRMDAFVAASRELEISSLAPQIDSIKDDVAGFIANPPKNLDDFMGDMQNMTSHIEAVFETIHDFRKITRVRAGSLFAGEADDFEVGSAKMLAAYMDTAEDELVRMMNQLTKNAKAVGLSDIQLARLTDLDNISRLELNNILATRTKITGIEAEIPDFHRTVRKLWKSDPNKAETMSKNFWASQKSRKADIWDEFDGLAGSFKSNRLLASRNFLMSVDKPVFVADYVPEVVGKLTPNHVAYLYGCTGDDLYRGLTRIHTQTRIRPRQDFIIHTRDHANAYAAKFGKTGAELGFTDEAIGEVYDQMWKSLGVNPSILTPDHPTMMQMEEMRQEIHRMYDVTKIADSDVIKWKKYLNSVADDAGQLGTFTDVGGTPDWWAKKESAMVKAKEMHYMAYPNYEDANIIDETMRAIFPFWNYELFRWKWLPRTFMRTPGVMSGLARYMEYTDQGYTSIPGTDLQINPLRGTVFMGGLRSFYLRDFPEFHDPIPGIEFLDYIGRAGFFPGIHVMLPIVGLSSMVSGQPLQIGELLPAWMKTSLSGLRALSPEHIGNILQYIYPDRFRDYMTMMQLASMGYDGDEIWKKKQQSQELTEEEEKLWLQATNNVDGIKGVLMNQTGLFRIRPDEFTQIRREMRLAIEEATGVPVRTQEWIDKMYPVTGKRFTDYYHLDIQQQALLYQWESYRR